MPRNKTKPTQWHQTRHLLLFLIAFRILNALLVKTFFQPDEFYQTLEPAWQLAFGEQSGAWITWEWKNQLRSSLPIWVFAALYRSTAGLAQLLGVSDRIRAEMLVTAPKLLQAVGAALMDYYIYHLAQKQQSSRFDTSGATLALSLLSPWQWFCSTRTLINSSEATLTAAALYYLPIDYFPSSQNNADAVTPPKHIRPKTTEISDIADLPLSIALATLSCVLRPQNAIIWSCIIGCHIVYILIRSYTESCRLKLSMVVRTCLAGLFVVSISILGDRLYYGKWTVPIIHFLRVNLVENIAVFYGKSRNDYYLTEGLPLLLTTSIPFAVLGMINAMRDIHSARNSESRSATNVRNASLVIASVVMILALSLISHKEVRFLYPLLPIILPFAGSQAYTYFESSPEGTAARREKRPRYKSCTMWAIVACNLFICLYATSVHQRGVMDIMTYLRDTRAQLSTDQTMSVGFLMPCHSVPWRSHLVWNDIKAWALSCEPPLHVPMEKRDLYMDEADIFYANPNVWLNEHMKDGTVSKDLSPPHTERKSWPDYLVFYEQLTPSIREFLANTTYKQCWKTFNSQFHDDWRRQGDIIVWCHHEI